jgi:hypothetical protein
MLLLPMKMLLMGLLTMLIKMCSFVDEDEEDVFLFLRQPKEEKREESTYRHAGKPTQPPASSYTNPTTSQYNQPKLHEIEKGKREGKRTQDSPLRSWFPVQHQKHTAPRLRFLMRS